MKWMLNMRVGMKIFLLNAVLLAALLVVSGYGMYGSFKLKSEFDRMYSTDLLGVNAAYHSEDSFNSASRALLNLALSKNNVAYDNFKTLYSGYMNEAHKALQESLLLLYSISFRESKGRELSDKLKLIQSKHEEVMAAIINGDLSAEEISNRIQSTKPLNDEIMVLFAELSALMLEEASVDKKYTDNLYWRMIIIFSTVLVLAFLGGVIFGRAIILSISKPLNELVAKAELIQAGDFKQDFNMIRKDEPGLLACSLAHMVSSLTSRINEAEQKTQEAAEQTRKANAAVEEVKNMQQFADKSRQEILATAMQVEEVVNRLSAATAELSAQVDESSHSANIQREQVISSATAMEEMNASVLEVAQNSSVAAESTEHARKSALDGQQIVSDSISAILEVQGRTNSLHDSMKVLSERAEAIGNIMGVISEIADQTNLLALNAAIEAARAGEAGRGFAVVADEVRKLAENTMHATSEVKGAVTGIQNETVNSSRAVEGAVEELAKVTELVNKSGQALNNIVTSSTNAAEQVQIIAMAAGQQSTASSEITTALDEINRLAQETAMVMQQSAEAVSELAGQTMGLQDLVAKLRKQ